MAFIHLKCLAMGTKGEEKQFLVLSRTNALS